MWIVDSSVWIDYFNGAETPQTNILHAALGKYQLGLTDIILAEVLQGFRHDKDFHVARQTLLQFSVYSMGGVELAIKSAENYRFLRRRGITARKTIDCLIATFVIEFGFSLLHSDRDFDPFEKHLALQVAR